MTDLEAHVAALLKEDAHIVYDVRFGDGTSCWLGGRVLAVRKHKDGKTFKGGNWDMVTWDQKQVSRCLVRVATGCFNPTRCDAKGG